MGIQLNTRRRWPPFIIVFKISVPDGVITSPFPLSPLNPIFVIRNKNLTSTYRITAPSIICTATLLPHSLKSLSDMTNGTLRSTLHRVVPVSHSESSHQRRRQCLAMFVGLNSDVMLHFDRKEECSDGEDTCTTKQSITYEEWRFQRIKRAQSVLKNVK